MFEFGDIRFRPIEKDDLKTLHRWENDFELIMYSRSKPINFVNMTQLEKLYEEWVKDKKHLRFIVELRTHAKEALGIARLQLGTWGNVRTADVGTYIGKKALWGKGLGQQITVALLEIAFNQLNADRCEAWSVEFNRRAHKSLEACGFKKYGAARQVAFVNGRKWDGYHFDILRDEYLPMRMELLEQTLNEKTEEYLQKHCPALSS
ncbi:GNAT family N-acetyltransferase [Candidatus Bathyarchaeota archaeon]|nr:GNAT family N-acetyltransferase [Candidatus Bathyarchaeota archaeon]